MSREPADRLGAADRDDGHALGREIAAAPDRERLQRDLVADALDQHHSSDVLHRGSLPGPTPGAPRTA